MKDIAIIIFTFQRVESSLEIIDSCKKTDLPIYVFHDFSGSNENLELGKLLSNMKYINLTIRKNKFGLKRNLIDGISLVSLKYKKFIVVEDDLLVSPELILTFNKKLDQYESSKDIFEVSSFPFLGEKSEDYPVKLPIGTSWLWGSWSNRWSMFIDFYKKPINLSFLEKIRLDYYFRYPFSYLYYLEKKNKISSWAIYKHIYMLKNNFNCLYFKRGNFKFYSNSSSSSTHGDNDINISALKNNWKKNILYLSKKNRLINFFKFIISCSK